MAARGNIKPGSFFTLFVLFLFVSCILTARNWQYQARLFPWVIGIPTLILCAIQLGLDIFAKNKSGSPDDTGGMMDLPVDRSVPVAIVIRRAANIFSWILGLFLSIWLVGFIVSVPLFVLLYLGLQAGEKWWVSLTYAGVMLLFLIGVFHLVLNVPWPAGVFPQMEDAVLAWLE